MTNPPSLTPDMPSDNMGSQKPGPQSRQPSQDGGSVTQGGERQGKTTPMTSSDMPSGELHAQIRDIINYIDNPYRLYGLGVKNEGYGKASATDAIMQLIENTCIERQVVPQFDKSGLEEQRATLARKLGKKMEDV